MKIVSASDWRGALPFDTPLLLSEVMPGDDTHCFVCGSASDPVPRTELWAFKHRHPKNPDGYVRFYCLSHRPAPPAAPAATPGTATAGRSKPRARTQPRERATPRKPVVPERQRAVCPDCFVEVAATGICGLCGNPVG